MNDKREKGKKTGKISKLVANGQIAEALEIADTNDISYLFKIGASYGEKGNHTVVERIFRRIIEINPKINAAWFNLGVALGNLGKYEEEIKNYDKAIEIDPNLAEVWCNRGVALGNLGKYEEAIKSYDKAIEIDPNDAGAWYNKGIALSRFEKYEEAIKSYDKAIEINPNDADMWWGKGIALSRFERYEEAIKSYDKAIEINPNDADVWYNKGIALSRFEKYEEAIKSYDKAIEINPNDADVWYGKGVAFKHLEKYEEAIKSYDKAIEINPNDADVWYGKGVAFSRFEKYEEAIKSYDKAIEINPNFAEAYGNLGIALLNRHEYDKAAIELRKSEALFAKKGAKKDASKAHKYELLAINASDLISELKPLDDQFIVCLNSQSLTELKEKALRVSVELQSVIRKFEKKRIHGDIKELLISKAICLTALSRAVNFEKVDLGKLGNTKIVFEKWGLDTFAIASSSIDTFSRFLKKYKSLDEIPKETEEYLLRGVLGASYILDGELTKEITSKISGEPFLQKPKDEEAIDRPRIIYKYIQNTEKEWVRFCLVQLDFSVQRSIPPKEFGYFLKEKDDVKNKVFKALDVARENKVDIICFPELSFAKEWVTEIESGYKDIIVIGGSYYDEGHNVCPIIIDGIYIEPPYKKHQPSPIENPETTGRGMKSGNMFYIFQTKCGRFAVLICIDYADQSYPICRYGKNGVRGVDFIINPCYDKNVLRFQPRCNSDCEDYAIDVIQVNKASDKSEFGGTCIIGKEHEIILNRLKDDEFKPPDDIKYKLVQIDGEMMIIAELNIEMKAPPVTVPIDYAGRIRVSKEKCYKYENGIWSPLSQ